MTEPLSPLPRVRRRVTWAGRLWFAATAALWGTGLYKGINLLTLLAYWLLLLWFLNRVLAGRQLRRLRVRRWADDAVFAGAPFAVLVEVENQDRRAHLGVRVAAPFPTAAVAWGDTVAAWFLPRLEPRGRVRYRQQLVLPRRGWYDWELPHLESGFPFGLVEGRLAAGPEAALLVYPALGRLHRGRLRPFLTRAVAALGQTRTRPERHPTAQSEFHGLRDYRDGDSPRWIHWRSSARRGSLMVREFEDYPTDNLVLVVEPWLPAAPEAGDEAAAQKHRLARRRLEAAVSFAATVCWEWCRQKGDRLVLAVAGAAEPVILDGVTGREHARLVMECLALLSGSPTVNTESLAKRLAVMPLPPAPVLVVSTRPSDLPGLLARRWHRAVAGLDVADLDQYAFYEAPRRS